MKRSRSLSPAARRLLAAMAGRASDWRHGYDLCREAGLKSGTLYPLLSRLEAEGYLTAEWREAETSGRPPRHVYRLTVAGVALAAANPVATADGGDLPVGRPA